MDTKIFKEFEDLIQHQSDFIINNYGQPAYDICCSVRDWFETCLKHVRPLLEDENYTPLGLYLYMDIVAADIFQKGAEKLFWNFLSGTTYKNKTVTHFFKNRKEASDDEHLKEVRAIFGAHPFQIGKVEKGNDRSHIGRVHYLGDSPRWLEFPTAIISRSDGRTESFSLDLDELKQFIIHRYGLLRHVTEKIQGDLKSFVELMASTPIPIAENMSPLEKLDILYEEAGPNKRGKAGNGFQDEVQKLRNMFSTSVTSPKNQAMVDSYREALLPIIKKYRDCLQSMDFLNSWKEEPLLNAFSLGLPDNYSWDIQNIRIESSKSPIAENCLKSLFHSVFDTTYASRKELYLLICAHLFVHSGNNEKS